MRISLPIVLAMLCSSGFCEDAPQPAAAPAPAKLIIEKGARIAIVGDSITEQKLYSKNIELYLTLCRPDLETHCIQLGWGGERAPGFLARMQNDLMEYKPTVVTTCYGMNDGNYNAFNENAGNTYKTAMSDIVSKLKAACALVVVGSPGTVDSKYYHGGGDPAKIYNNTLGKLREIAKKLAEDNQFPFADVYGALESAMEKGKAALGETYDVCGKDGVHPQANGHLVMAYAFLKAMGFDGQIGTITVDLKGEATASDGHKILSSKDGKVEIESSRSPFCFHGDEKASNGTRSILPYVPFNQDLNRFTLIVKNLESEKVKITWGKESKSFSKAELEAGVNLAANFFDNPFMDQFKKVDHLISDKQNFETTMIKSWFHSLWDMSKTLADKEVDASLEGIKAKLYARQAKLEADVKAAVAPVKHTIVIEAEK
jgi:lysophospholipase L1-like esterase